MDVQHTIEFIWQSQARAEARMGRAKARMERMEAQCNRRIHAITRLMQPGMKWMARLEKAQADLAVAHKELVAVQKQTDRELPLFLDSLRKAGNGCLGR